ncbi:MAG: DUF445 family protein [Victivallales bacterium]|jgi:uncharacterized membrane protein YheB (UPF0754 family)|nr:DUF445 family protein [Victivallales bacterium]MBT7304272.1 DUF445 family protein [Victivallales bacterium]
MSVPHFLLFPLVGAIIGALTNHLAIRMLFRPFVPWSVLGMRVPFTPGVIPRQREKLATKIAQTFEKHLISGKHLHELITGPRMAQLLNEKVDGFIGSLGVLGGMVKGLKPTIVQHLGKALEEVASRALESGGPLDVGKLIEDRVNEMDLRELERMILQVTKTQLQHITVFGGILGALIGVVQACLAMAI